MRLAGVVRGVVAGSAVLLLVGVPLVAAADEVELTIDDPSVTESSGLARDTTAGLYWTVNDSGDTSRAVAVDPSGEVVGEVAFAADVVDVEAVARTPDGLYVADIGDNGGDREFITVYRLGTPTPGTTSTYNAWDLRYADGEAHDAEAVVVTPGGRLLVITKEQEAGVWAAPTTPTGQGMNTLERIGDAPPWVTDATVLEDGRIAVRGYLSVSLLDPDDFSVLASAPLPLQPQGESLTQSLDGEALLVGSEGRRSQVLRVPVPEAVTEDVPNPSAPPTGSPAPAPDPEEQPRAEVEPVEQTQEPAPETGGDDPTDSGAASSRSGTFMAVALAALLALIGGAVVFLVGRPRDGEEDGNEPGPGADGDEAPQSAAAEPDDGDRSAVGPISAEAGAAAASGATAAALPVEVAGQDAAEARDARDATTVSQPAVDAEGEPVPGAPTAVAATAAAGADASSAPAVREPGATSRLSRGLAAARRLRPSRTGQGPGDPPAGDAAPPPAAAPSAAVAPAVASSDPGDRPQPAGPDDPGYVLSEEAPGRVTWSEPAGGAAEGPDQPRRAHAEDLDWLYEER